MTNKPQINPWLSVWTKPRATIAEMIRTNPRYGYTALSAMCGFPILLQWAQMFSLGLYWKATLVVIVALLLCIPVGMLAITIGSGLLYWTGKWIGGVGEYPAVRAAVSWANLPNLVTNAIWLLFIGFMGSCAFAPDLGTEAEAVIPVSIAWLFLIGGTVQLGMTVWSIVIFLVGLSEVQKFSVWKAVLNIIIPFFLLVIASWVLVFLAGLVMSTPSMN